MFYITVIAFLASAICLATLIMMAYLYFTRDLASNNLKRQRVAVNAIAQVLIDDLNK